MTQPLVASLLLVVRPGAPSSVLAPNLQVLSDAIFSLRMSLRSWLMKDVSDLSPR